VVESVYLSIYLYKYSLIKILSVMEMLNVSKSYFFFTCVHDTVLAAKV